jgi:signal peptidase I
MALIEELKHRIVVYREPWFAVNVSTFFAGLGQIYAGNIKRGSLLIAIQIILLFISFYYAFSLSGNITVSIIFLFLSIILLLWNLYDSYKITSKSNDEIFELVRKVHKDPWLSMFLTRIIPGLGHLYLKKWIAGIIFIICFIVILILIIQVNLYIIIVLPFYYTYVCYHSYTSTPIKRDSSTKILLLTSLLILIGSTEVIVLPLFTQSFFFESFKISNNSMEPTLMIDDLVLVKKANIKNLQRGDIIVFKNPDDNNQLLIKRYVGKEYEWIELKNNNIYVNGNRLVEKRFENNMYQEGGIFRDSTVSVKIPKGEIFVIGDNKISLDSRYFGTIKAENIIGKAIKIYLPLSRAGEIN